MSVIDTLIYDRTEEDVDRVYTLKHKILAATATDEEIAEYLAGMKGAYNASDLNRVNTAVQYLASRLKNQGYSLPAVSTRTDWTHTDWPTASEMETYLSNVAIIRKEIPVFATTPDVPESADYLDWAQANDIERILKDVDEILTCAERSWYFSGELYAGEV